MINFNSDISYKKTPINNDSVNTEHKVKVTSDIKEYSRNNTNIEYTFDLTDILDIIPRIKKSEINYENNQLNKDFYEELSDFEGGKEKFCEYYKNKLESRLENAQTSREKAVALALFFALDLPKLPYSWGGSHNPKSIDVFSPENLLLHLAGNGKNGDNSFDCSSFVTCAIHNSGLDASEFANDGRIVMVTADIKNSAKPFGSVEPREGDLAFMEGHVGFIVEVDKSNNEMVVVHSSDSGDGISIMFIDLETGLVKENIGAESTGKRAVGQKYFDSIVQVDYGEATL